MKEQKALDDFKEKTNGRATSRQSQEISSDEVEEMQRELHMSGRAMKMGETLEDYNRERRLSWETKREQTLAERYSNLSPEMQTQFVSAQEGAVSDIQEYIQGKRTLENLSLGEAQVLEKLKASYEEFKKRNVDEAFAAQFGQEVDQKTFENLVREIAFSRFDSHHSQNKANEIRTQLGIPLVKHPMGSSILVDKVEVKEAVPGLENISQDEYADWLVDNMLEEKDLYDQLTLRPEYRAFNKKQRAEIVAKNPTSQKLKDLAVGMNKLWGDTVNQPMEGIKAIGKGSGSWDNFQINEGLLDESVDKGYLTFKDVENDLTPEVFLSFIQQLKNSGYNGQVKTATAFSAFRFRFDNIVFHGKTKDDVGLAMGIAKSMFRDKLLQTQYGRDGKNQESHTDLLAEKVKLAREKKGTS
jgi:hypothetical protein